MALEYQIDHVRRVVFMRCHGTLTDQEVFDYQREVWSRRELAGYDEICDVTDVEHIALPSTQRVIDLATLAAQMDVPQSTSRLAIVAPEGRAYGLGRMYQTYRELDERSTKKVAVFRTLPAALEWLGIDPGENGPDTWQSRLCS
jgi:hypothetical protein